MASPVCPGSARPISGRSVFRVALAACVAASMVLRPGSRRPSSARAKSLIRDTEIEEILHKDAAPIFQAAGIDPKGIQIILIGSKDFQRLRRAGGHGRLHGLILQTKNPNELQGVMAHEVGPPGRRPQLPLRRDAARRHGADDPDHGPGRSGGRWRDPGMRPQVW